MPSGLGTTRGASLDPVSQSQFKLTLTVTQARFGIDAPLNDDLAYGSAVPAARVNRLGPTSAFSKQGLMGKMRKRKVQALSALYFWIQFSKLCLGETICTNVDGSPLPASDACILGTVLCDLTTWYETTCWVDGQLCPRPSQPTDPIQGVNGHFISASISWKAIGGNSVEFEIMSTWRYSFMWPTQNPNIYTGPCGFPGVGDVVPIVGISANPNILYGQQSAPGTVSLKLYSG